MYILSVPLMLEQVDRYGAQVYIDKLKEIGAQKVFLARNSYQQDSFLAQKEFDALKKHVPVFQKAGFEVGAWLWTFQVLGDNNFTHITSPNGAVSKKQVCPSDQEFVAFMQEYLKNIAKSNPDIILFDDDFRYGFLDCGLGCACKNPRAYMEQILGEKLPEENLGELILGGAKNKYRSAFLKANGHFFREFAKKEYFDNKKRPLVGAV